ncbi:ABC transporter permease [Bradyrhizobium erythrophlei]|uniref:Spermidine/putrescine transport system permease protein n=1 Tax=Bradyrhizobium erythrophlei TaxID=1437360 RepID=A0A1H4UMK3_9BRAD|nr:ABC transporter permease [Bradyrhizobium erythrophlei]SEC69935.1 spermidine/putrescine transport system permease protein [Bradyrhizobium erythrophlei]
MKAHDLREGTRAAALGGWTALVFLFVFAPIVSTVVFSFNADRFPSLPWGGFSLAWYAAVLTDDSVRRSLMNSLIVAAATAAIATGLGFAAAYVDYRFRFFGKRAYLALASLPPTVPVVILGVAMLTFEGRIGLSGTLTGVVAGHVVLCSPFAMALVRMRLADLDRDLEPAAWNLGATAWTSLREIVIPFALPSILASLFITAAVSFDEYMIAWFVSGLNETLPVRVLAMLQGQVSPRINAVGSLVFAVSAILVVLAQILTRRKI